jgi:uncharacterized surface protein with fasciclin (FAS1) repeats
MKPSARKPDSNSSSKPKAARPVSASRPRENGNDTSPYAESLLEKFARHPRLQAFSSAIGTAGLATLLGGDGPLTIFAPTDKAFGKIPSEQLSALLGDSTRLAELIRHHVVAGRVKAPRVTRPRTVTPEFGDALELTASDRGFHVDEARIVKTNIRASNGVIHAIDRVLDPRMIAG